MTTPQLTDQLFAAASAGDRHLEKLRATLAAGAAPDALEPAMGWAALHCAGRREQLEPAHVLHTFKADPNVRTRDEGASALHLAMEAGNPAMVNLMMAHGADPWAVDKDGRTPMEAGTDPECRENLRLWMGI